jgi:hypothetical protein
MGSTRKNSLILTGLFAGLVATTACAAVSDDAQSTSAAFARPGTGQRFLLAYYSGDGNNVGPYNGRVFQGTPPAYPDDLASPGTLRDWKRKFIPASEPVVHALYTNKMELGFWRDMTCTKRFVRGGPGGCFVVNYNLHEPGGVENDGTVAMHITRDGFVHFEVYEPYQTNSSGINDPDTVRTSSEVFLDREGGKVTPHVCVNCHGGTITNEQDLLRQPDLGSVFREFEPSLLGAAPGVDQATAEQQWYDLNQAVLAANAALRGESDGAISGLERTRSAVDGHIRDLYAGLGEPRSHANPPFSRSPAAPELVPQSWRAQDADSQALWSKLVNPYCMECHRHNGLDFSDFDNFSFLRPASGGRSTLLDYLYDDGRVDTGRPYMPQAQFASELLQSDLSAWQAIRRWSGLSAPEAVVTIPAAQPHWPGVIAVSTDTVTLTAPGPTRVRIVNASTHELYACLFVVDECVDEEQRLPAGEPGAPPPELDYTLEFTEKNAYPWTILLGTDDPGGGGRDITVRRGF